MFVLSMLNAALAQSPELLPAPDLSKLNHTAQVGLDGEWQELEHVVLSDGASGMSFAIEHAENDYPFMRPMLGKLLEGQVGSAQTSVMQEILDAISGDVESSFASLGELDGRAAYVLERTIALDNHFGAAVDIANMVSEDAAGRVTTPEATVGELVVGEPGYPAGAGEGRVFVFLTGPDAAGPDLSKYVAELSDSSLGAASLGESLAHGYSADSTWQDLGVGAPLAAGPVGAVVLTRTEPTATSCSTQSLYGHWEWDTADGGVARVSIIEADGDTRIVFGEEFFFGLVRQSDGATVCEGAYTTSCDAGDTGCVEEEVVYDVEGYLPSGTTMDLPGTLLCGDSSKTWSGVDMKPLVIGLIQGTGVWGQLDQDTIDFINAATIEADIEITLDLAAGTMSMSYDFATGFWSAVTGAMNAGVLDICVPNLDISPFAGSYVGEATCDPL